MAGCDASVASAARPSLVDELRRRVTFQERPATQLLVLVLLLWFGVQLGTLYLGWTVQQWQWVFTTESFPALSPGLVLATISHNPANVTHVLANVALLWLFAGESEQHMSGVEIMGFFVVTALVSVTVNTTVTGDSTLGASGGALAFVGFYGAHLLFAHRDGLALDTSDYGALDKGALRAYWQGALLLFPPGFALFTIGQYTGVVPAGRVAVIGHFVGLVLGVGYAVGRDGFWKDRHLGESRT
ncbi:rhomboid family intramembrane serine protease [Haloarcula sediminis]|uniref:rhomboid family intramembrane serine protease n=1 Tax=Haloarcula sediminis TaxID=3111777 RepID=UPI002D770990|nr:rhomboid family intramembrane serine protease [Haloarcula sp. CK38]